MQLQEDRAQISEPQVECLHKCALPCFSVQGLPTSAPVQVQTAPPAFLCRLCSEIPYPKISSWTKWIENPHLSCRTRCATFSFWTARALQMFCRAWISISQTCAAGSHRCFWSCHQSHRCLQPLVSLALRDSAGPEPCAFYVLSAPPRRLPCFCWMSSLP